VRIARILCVRAPLVPRLAVGTKPFRNEAFRKNGRSPRFFHLRCAWRAQDWRERREGQRSCRREKAGPLYRAAHGSGDSLPDSVVQQGIAWSPWIRSA